MRIILIHENNPISIDKHCQIKYNSIMDNKSYIKSLLVLNNMPISKLASIMTEKSGKIYTIGSLYGKLSRDTLTLKECQLIASAIGYHIEFLRNN